MMMMFNVITIINKDVLWDDRRKKFVAVNLVFS